MTHLMTIMSGPTHETVAAIIAVAFPDALTALDMTYGSGRFWGKQPPLRVTGMDRDPARAPHVLADFRALPFADGSFDLAVFDPPFLSDCGRDSVMGARFGAYPTIADLEAAVMAGIREAWRVARIGVLYKGQDYIHGQQKVYMSRWPEALLGLPYDQVDQIRPKLIDPKWRTQLSAWSNSSTYSVWRKDGARHRDRRPGERVAS